jgi:hypothetical protein
LWKFRRPDQAFHGEKKHDVETEAEEKGEEDEIKREV